MQHFVECGLSWGEIHDISRLSSFLYKLIFANIMPKEVYGIPDRIPAIVSYLPNILYKDFFLTFASLVHFIFLENCKNASRFPDMIPATFYVFAKHSVLGYETFLSNSVHILYENLKVVFPGFSSFLVFLIDVTFLKNAAKR